MPDAVYKLRAPSKEPKLNFGILIREKEEREREKERDEWEWETEKITESQIAKIVILWVHDKKIICRFKEFAGK